MKNEYEDEELKENIEEEKLHIAFNMFMESVIKEYKDLTGKNPDELSLAEIQHEIIIEKTKRNINRPYKL